MFNEITWIIITVFGTLIAITSVLLFLILRSQNTRRINLYYTSLSEQELLEYAKKSAAAHRISQKSDFLKWPLTDLDRNYALVSATYKNLDGDIRRKIPVPASAEWLLDNFYIITEQVLALRRDLNKKSYSKLPTLKSGQMKGYARIYAVCTDLVALTNGQIDEKYLSDYLKTYQEDNILFEREIDAIPIALKLALVESLGDICESIRETRLQWQKAEETFKMISGDRNNIKWLKEHIKDVDSAPAYIEHLHYCLRRSENNFSKTAHELNIILESNGTNVDKITRKEHNNQSLIMVSMSNIITSLRHFSSLDWSDLMQSASSLEKILTKDPEYSKMDISTRSRYRKNSEKLAAEYRCSELHIANDAIRLAENEREAPMTHVGYYLIGDGKNKLIQNINKTNKQRIRLPVHNKNFGKRLYFAGIIAIAAVLILVVVQYYLNKIYLPYTILAAIAALIPASEIAIQLVNKIICSNVKPALLPKMELKEGIPPEFSTMVVIPTLLPHAKRVQELLDTMESHYLANRDDNLYFALLGAFKDANHARIDGDEEVIEAALSGISKLNKKYASGKQDKFYFFHRSRHHNKSNNKWIGWERKRGALLEFGRLLSGEAGTSIKYISKKPPTDVKYVITLDCDTILPLGMARAMVGTMAHPLNRPVLNEKHNVVTSGYGILQPRVDVDMECTSKTVFSRIFTTQEGIDPYSGAISDVYQDLFGEGIFTGKGIYDLAVYQKVLMNRFADNTVLSHDLLEGSYLRAGLATDLKLVDSFPVRYNAHASRQLRWIRGDWQLLPHLLPTVRTGKKLKKAKNPLSALSKWKIADNLRRSLVAPALMLLVFLSFVLPYELGFTALFIVFFLPLFIDLFGTLIAVLPFKKRTKKYLTVFGSLKSSFSESILAVSFLPYQAWQAVSGVFLTLTRLATGKNLLSWVTSADVEVSQTNTINSYMQMMSSALWQTFVISLLAFSSGTAWALAPLLILWGMSPLIAFWISNEKSDDISEIPEEQRIELGMIARKTWRYFEEFADAKSNWLAPDNYQADPPRGIAWRTSPTNIGLGLMSILTARDLGYIGTVEMIDLADKTITTIEKLEKWNGHLYNWYDIRTLKPLKPEYVSTVDSGNLSGYLITLEQGLKKYFENPTADENFENGIRDTLYCAGDDGISAWKEMGAMVTAEYLSDKIKSEDWKKKLLHMLLMHKRKITDTEQKKLELLLERIEFLWKNVSFIPLYDKKKKLFSIGYNIADDKLTGSYYDLLASEARQASYIAIARGEIPSEHWFRLGRTLTVSDGYKGLVSWTGTMFEYLMPLLIMKQYKNTLLDETYSFVMKCQKKYGKLKNMPWGVSESAFYSLDNKHDYQYKAIGVPSLGLKRGLSADSVVAPYATILALLVDPIGATENIYRLKKEGLYGAYGLYEAADYTKNRLIFELRRVIVKSYMSHHQGMILVALNNYFNNGIMQNRFHSNPEMNIARLLLQEKTPANVIITKKEISDITEPVNREHRKREVPKYVKRAFNPMLPAVHILTNGNYSVMLTEDGTGYSKSRMAAVTRWREDRTLDPYGMFFYLRNIENNEIWSAARSPFIKEPDKYDVLFESDKVVYTRTDDLIETKTEIIVASGDNTEIRRITLKNTGKADCTIEITSYFEVVITPQAADMAHPAFSNLFVETDFLYDRNCIIASRRPRTDIEKRNWLAHTVITKGAYSNGIQFETDRMQFLGRGNTPKNPDGIQRGKPLSGTVGAVLDPIASLRVRITVLPGKTASATFITLTGGSKERIMTKIDTYRSHDTINRTFQLALERGRIETQFRNLTASQVELYREVISHILFISPLRQKHKEFILENKKGQSSLWKYGISGDDPIVLALIDKEGHVGILYELLKAHEYWTLMDIKVDLVIVVNEEHGYEKPLYNLVSDIVSSNRNLTIFHSPNDIFILSDVSDLPLLYEVARVVFEGGKGNIQSQLSFQKTQELPKFEITKTDASVSQNIEKEAELLYDNELGGFRPDGTEYIIYLGTGQNTPAPWINVIANPNFGFTASESGSGYTWSDNSHEYRLTPWGNDTVSDSPSEVFYLTNKETGVSFTPTPLPIREETAYKIRHGFGYTIYEHNSHGITQCLTQFVPVSDSVKISILKLHNQADTPQNLAVTHYVRTVLGVNPQETSMHIRTSKAKNTALLIENPYNEDFSQKVCFMHTSGENFTVTGDRWEFFGGGDMSSPDCLKQISLSGTVGIGHDPCGAVKTDICLKANESIELVFLTGTAPNTENAKKLAKKYSDTTYAKKALSEVKQFWKDTLETIQVSTPDISINIMLNGWLQYQVISSRLWGRTGHYQSGGAYGFRDQLQDSLALAVSEPKITRKQILLHAKHQFASGDVQHWWHEPGNKGVRTKISDDLLWLPYVTLEYIRISGDESILSENIPFISGAQLGENEAERYDKAKISEESATLYTHCNLAISKSLNFGVHGLPLMGSGDWNDGMNMVGIKGKGESVWLAWFLISVLDMMTPLCKNLEDLSTVEYYTKVRADLKISIEKFGWDGDWYRRAYFDDDSPLGSILCNECKIDSIAQSWSVLSGAADKDRAIQAMSMLEDYLVSREFGLIKLLTPPFDTDIKEPGYIKGYVPGVRENGGQYTHAAAWAIMAFASSGSGNKATELYALINPVNHTGSRRDCSNYKVEPYVMAADVYAAPPHMGRGGWSWYTGAAGWMYRAGIENILGLQKNGDILTIDPCISCEWKNYEITYKYHETTYNIQIINKSGVEKGVKYIVINGKKTETNQIKLVNYGGNHDIQVIMG